MDDTIGVNYYILEEGGDVKSDIEYTIRKKNDHSLFSDGQQQNKNGISVWAMAYMS